MSSALQQASPITVEQYEQFQGYPVLRDELIYGQIVMSPQPKPFHQQVGKNIMRFLDEALQGQPYTAQQNSNLQFVASHSMPAPDIFVVGKTHWNQACLEDRYVSDAPILVVEIVSPANRKKAVMEKVLLYLHHDVQEIWLVYPKRRTVEIVRSNHPAAAQTLLTLPSPLSGALEAAQLFLPER